MDASTAALRLRRPLVAVVAALLVLGVVGAVVRAGSGDEVVDGDRADAGSADAGLVDPGDDASSPGAGGADATVDTADDPGDGVRPGGRTATTGSAVLPAQATPPAAGAYRYRVERTSDGESTTFDEMRIIDRLDEDAASSTVRIEVRTDGQRQISVLDWAAGEVTVRSTRVPSASDDGSECAWDPPITEFGPLVDGASWSVRSTCTADVAGVPSTFSVEGSARVLGDVVVRVGERDLRVWRIERVRLTVITAELDGGPVEQRVEERGDLYLDPARGIVVQSDAVVTVSGSQEGTTRRRSTLVS